jgi:hypothetical protein
MNAAAMANTPKIDPDEALWDKARGMLAEEVSNGDPRFAVTDEDARLWIERHAPAYAASLIREDEDLEAMYDEAHARLAMAFGDSLPHNLDPSSHIVALAAPIVVHAALEARS